jgi:hypothetical protein
MFIRKWALSGVKGAIGSEYTEAEYIGQTQSLTTSYLQLPSVAKACELLQR